MDKEVFLIQLRRALQGLAPDRIDEILEDYRTHFDESAANGRSDDETAAALGDPSWLGQQHIADLLQSDDGLWDATKRLWASATRREHNGKDVIARELRWTPGPRMMISLPAEVTWRPAKIARAVLHGPAWLIEHVHPVGQHLRGRFNWRFFHNNLLCVDLEGPSIDTWTVTGSGSLHLHHLSQPSLSLELKGSGVIKAAGIVQHVALAISGSGDIDLSLLDHEHAVANVVGCGEAILAPSEEADLSVDGWGDIRLLSRPARIKTNILGNGDIRTSNGVSLSL